MDTPWSPAVIDWLPDRDELLALPSPSESRSPRLGLVFEHLWQHWLQQTGWRWQANLQIQSSQRTLGELDLLIQPPPLPHRKTAQPPIHAELALKFYLGVGEDWIGPNRRDYLARKLSHTQHHQLPLSQTDAARTTLTENQWSKPEPISILRGCLFYPADPQIQATPPDNLNSTHWRGHWCHHQTMRALLPDGYWYLLAKDEWISPALSQIAINNEELFHLLDVYFQYVNTPVCLARMKSGFRGWAEIERWFIMPDHWPVQSVSATPL